MAFPFPLNKRSFVRGMLMKPASQSIFSRIGHAIEVAFADLKRPSSSKAADCVFIVGPDIAEDIPALERNARHLKINAHFIGDGVQALSKEMIQSARQKGIIGDNTEVICINHGNVSDTGDSAGKHLLFIGSRARGDRNAMPAVEMLRWLREPVSTESSPEKSGDAWRGNVHFMACKVGRLGKRPEQMAVDVTFAGTKEPILKLGHVILHGSSKNLATEVALDNCISIMRHIAFQKEDKSGTVDPQGMLKRVVEGTVDTVTLLGADLEQPVVIHAPKSVIEILPEHFASLRRQEEAHANLDGTLSPNLKISCSVSARSMKSTMKQGQATISEAKLANYLMTRLIHLKTYEKLQRLETDLKSHGKLLKIRFAPNLPALSFVCAHFSRKTQGVRASDVAKVFIDCGTDVNAIDAWGASALLHAARSGDQSLIELLAKRGADDSVRDKSGKNALHHACEARENKSDAVDAILKHCKGIDVNRADKRGMTPLHMAIKARDAKAVEVLLGAGADPTKGVWFWDSPARMAARLGDQQLADRLRAAARSWHSRPAPRPAT